MSGFLLFFRNFFKFSLLLLLDMLLESQLFIKPQPQILWDCTESYLLPLYIQGGGLNWQWRVNSTASIFVVGRFSPADLIQWVIASRAVFTFHLNMGILSSAVTTRVLLARKMIFTPGGSSPLDAVKDYITKQKSKSDLSRALHVASPKE